MNKQKIFLLIGAFWIVLIGGFIGIKEFTLQTGNDILLKTVPVDPRDLFRGDYVILRYEISTIDTNAYASLNASSLKVDDKVYVALDIDNEKIGTISEINREVPTKGIFIKGTIKSIYGNNLIIEYGLESYFVPEGKGGEIERNRGNIFTKAAVDKFGNAVIKSLMMEGKEIKF